MLSGVDGSKHNLFVFKPCLEPSTRSILELLIHLRYNCAVRGGITMISSGTVDVRAFAVTRIRIFLHGNYACRLRSNRAPLLSKPSLDDFKSVRGASRKLSSQNSDVKMLEVTTPHGVCT